MKRLTIINPPAAFWLLRDPRGEFYAYSLPDTGVRCTDRVDIAMKYTTRKGAKVAAANVLRAYGKTLVAIKYKTIITYEPA